MFLGSILCSKYWCALEIKATHSTLRDIMQRLGIESRDIFEAWLKSKKTYLCMLSKELLEEMMKMEYYQKLVNLQYAEQCVIDVCKVALPFLPVEAAAGYAEAAASMRWIETQWWHVLELHAKVLAIVQDLEVGMGVQTRWIEGDEKWEAAVEMVYKCRYQCALNLLEGLVIAQILRCQHIAKALQACSKAIKATIIWYNKVAEEMDPPMPTLDWEEVVEFASLADFDLL
ncbi:hypothetical protein B0H19DRAFT_1249101 [Mycena capillaripes]|nr:hypothetical protein B0H19DRAFT_1249101 [Mycena capillaripes]